MAKPTAKPNWTYNNPDEATEAIEPVAQKKVSGFVANERPAHQLFNWLFRNISLWIDHFDDTNSGSIVVRNTYDAIVGGTIGKTHDSLNAVMADPSIPAADIRILVNGPLVFSQTQVINKDGTEIFGTPGGTLSKGGATVKGLSIAAQRVKIRDCRFLNWNETNGIALELTAAAVNCLIDGNNFHSVTSDITDLGRNNVIVNNILEE